MVCKSMRTDSKLGLLCMSAIVTNKVMCVYEVCAVQ